MEKTRMKLVTSVAKVLVRLRIADAMRVSDIQKEICDVPDETAKTLTFIVVRGADHMFRGKANCKIKSLKPLN